MRFVAGRIKERTYRVLVGAPPLRQSTQMRLTGYLQAQPLAAVMISQIDVHTRVTPVCFQFDWG